MANTQKPAAGAGQFRVGGEFAVNRVGYGAMRITGQPGNFRIQPNPLSVIAPGLLRKFFEFRDTTQPAFADPNR